MDSQSQTIEQCSTFGLYALATDSIQQVFAFLQHHPAVFAEGWPTDHLYEHPRVGALVHVMKKVWIKRHRQVSSGPVSEWMAKASVLYARDMTAIQEALDATVAAGGAPSGDAIATAILYDLHAHRLYPVEEPSLSSVAHLLVDQVLLARYIVDCDRLDDCLDFFHHGKGLDYFQGAASGIIVEALERKYLHHSA